MDRRTALITAGSIVAVVLTGATAIGANIGILSSAAASDLGELGAVMEVAPVPALNPNGTQATGATTDTAQEPVTRQEFEADSAGVVEVSFTSSTIRLGDVSPRDGWQWTGVQPGDDELIVTFVSTDERRLVFIAELLPDGSVAARVDEEIVDTVSGEPELITVVQQGSGSSPSPSPTPTSTSAGVDDDDFDDSDFDDDDFDDDHDDDDDDDDFEFEGADDDD